MAGWVDMYGAARLLTTSGVRELLFSPEFLYISNIRTLSVIFASDLASPTGMKQREDHVIDVVMSYLGK